MDTSTSIAVLVIAVVLAAIALLGDRARRRQPLAGHALIPWTALLFVSLTAAAVVAAHLLGLAPQR